MAQEANEVAVRRRFAPRASAAPTKLEVAVIGTGFSGLCMGIELKRSGIHDFLLFERSARLGGTWRDNTYPGCACDIPSHLYSYSFEPNARWSRVFAPHDEILAYLDRCAEKYGLLPHVRTNQPIVEAVYDETTDRWTLRTASGERFSARFLVCGLGPLSNPSIPNVPGLERFEGTAMHSARWDHGYDFRGKRVAVVGTGASAIQIVPALQPEVASLHLFQRSPAWVIPKGDRAFSPLEKLVFARLPGARLAYRQALYWWHEFRGLAFFRPDMLDQVRLECRASMERSIRDPELRRRLTPDYGPGCKRILLSDDYYPALARPNVEVIDGGIDEVRAGSVVAEDGRETLVDAIVWCTGFRVHDYVGSMRIVGRNGAVLNDLWREQGASGFLGATVAGFPNLFTILGPNSGLSYSSMVVMIEGQARYARAAIHHVRARRLRSLEVKKEAQEGFNDDVQERTKRSALAESCNGWYHDRHGRNVTLWPGPTSLYRWKTRRFDPRDYILE